MTAPSSGEPERGICNIAMSRAAFSRLSDSICKVDMPRFVRNPFIFDNNSAWASGTCVRRFTSDGVSGPLRSHGRTLKSSGGSTSRCAGTRTSESSIVPWDSLRPRTTSQSGIHGLLVPSLSQEARFAGGLRSHRARSSLALWSIKAS